jgi:hypothetical protein
MKTCDINLSTDELLIAIDALRTLQDEHLVLEEGCTFEALCNRVDESKMLGLLIDKLKICLHMAKEDE